MAICGFAFLAIDTEHSPIEIEGNMGILQAIKSGNPNCKALIIVSDNSYSEIKKNMDAGANGFICPMVNSREEAQVLVVAVKYSPFGKRGVSYSKSNSYGLTLK